VIVRMTPEGERLGPTVRIDNDPFELARQIASWGESPEVVLEATYGSYWAADVLADAGATVHLAHPLGVKGFAYRRFGEDPGMRSSSPTRPGPCRIRCVRSAGTRQRRSRWGSGFDADLATDITRVTNQLRDALLHVHPALERVFGRGLCRYAVLEPLTVAPTPGALRELGESGMAAVLGELSQSVVNRLPAKILAALAEQTVQVPGTVEFGRVIAHLAGRLRDLLRERDAVAALEAKLSGHPTFEIIRSIPGLGANSAAKLLVAIGDGSRFPTAAHLASYAGLAPVTRQSGSSIGSQRAARRGNLQVRQIFYLAAMASLTRDPISRRYYDRKRAEGKRATAALLCLARRKANLLHAMIRNGTPYQDPLQSYRRLHRAASHVRS